MEKFPLLAMAFEAIEAGGTMPCVLNAANEVAVAAFLQGEIKFTDMYKIVESTMSSMSKIEEVTMPHLIATNREAVALAREKAAQLRR